MNYSLIFKFCPGPGIIFSDILRQSRYGKAGIIAFSEGQYWEAWAKNRDEIKMNKLGLRFFSDKQKYLRYKRDIEQMILEMESVLKIVASTDFKSLSSSELLKLFSKTSDIIKKYINYYFYTEFFCFDLIESKINKIFESRYSGESLRENLAIILTPSGHFSAGKKDKCYSDHLSGQHRRIFEEMNLSQKDRYLIEVVQEMQEIKYDLRVFLNKFFFGEGSSIFQFVREIGRRYYLARNQVNMLTVSEIKDVLSGKRMIGIKEISARQRSYFISTKTLVSGGKARVMIDRIKPKNLNKMKSILGSTANRGIAQGKAKIIHLTTDSALTSREIEKMEAGQVLVADTTGPELIIACKKAIAIVADEGGINSHAAITSRELNIPCIVGTKIATDVIKDGDMVEIDANSGVVTILSRED